VFSVATTTIAKELPSQFFKILGTIFSLAVVLLWIVVTAGTLRGALSGELFFAPCLKQWEAEQAERKLSPEKVTAS